MQDYATIDDITSLWRPLTPAESEKASALIPIVTDLLRQEADAIGKDLDALVACGKIRPNVLKSVIVDVVARYLMTPNNEAPMSQMSQSALGYSFSGTYLVPGGGIYIKKAELARLGLKKQRIGVIDLAPRHNCHADQEN